MKLARAVMDFLFAPQAVCMGCGSVLGCDQDWLCADCFARLAPLYARERARADLCPECGEPAISGKCVHCGSRATERLPACAAYVYQPPVDAMVRKFKFDSVYRMDEWMGREMVRAIRASRIPETDLAVPVPMHALRKLKRGFNQSERLARVVARELGLPVEDALVRRRNTRQQAKLAGEARRENLKNAFSARRDVSGARVLLVDDVRTTGSTVCACARALYAAGARCVCVCTFAEAEGGGRAPKVQGMTKGS